MTTSRARRVPPTGHPGTIEAILHQRVSRRNVLRLAALASAGAGAAMVAGSGPLRQLRPARALGAAPYIDIALAATDGWIYVPGDVPGPTRWQPVPARPDVTHGKPRQSGSAQHVGVRLPRRHGAGSKPRSSASARTSRPPRRSSASTRRIDVHLNLRNLGLSVRPDLTDSHTIHWHGFRNAIPLFDGVPELSVAVPIGRDFTYFYRPSDTGPGSYMYHCHFEDVEHVSMGMTGIVYVRAAQNHGGAGIATARWALGDGQSADADATGPMGYTYNDGLPDTHEKSTAYDREYGIFLTEMWAQEHWEGAHIQEHDWSEYRPDIWLMNGRSYPDTLAAPGGGTDPWQPATSSRRPDGRSSSTSPSRR